MQDRDLGGEEVVVAERDLVGRRRVVLVDHRHDAPVEQPPQRPARVEVVAARAHVEERQQHLRARHAAARAAARRRRGRACPDRRRWRPAGPRSRVGRTPRPMISIPRAIAPLVTTTTSSPAPWRAATSSQIERSDVGAQAAGVVGDDARSELDDDRVPWPEPSDVARSVAGHRRPAVGRRRERPGSSSNTTPAISTSSPGSKPALLELADHAHAAQRLLDVRQRLLVLEVVARDQALDPRPADAERARRPRSTANPRLAAGRKTLCSASASAPARRDRRVRAPARGAAARRASSSRPCAGRARGDQHRDLVAEPLAPRRGAPRRASSAGTRSAFDSASSRGSAARRASCAASSASIVAWFAAGSEPSTGARSSTCTSSRVRSTCARNSWPRPAPSLAPSIRPGMSAMHELALGAVERAEHRLERRERVVGDLRRGARQPREQRRLAGVRQPDEADVGEQLAAAARSTPSSPGSPRSANRGAWRVGVAKRLLPRPPSRRARRPLAAPARRGRSARRPRRPRPACRAAPAHSSRSPSAPWRFEPSPWPPRAPCSARVRLKLCRSRSESSQTSTTSPPWPPSPPSGPPRGRAPRGGSSAAVAAAAGLDEDPCRVVEHETRSCSWSPLALPRPGSFARPTLRLRLRAGASGRTTCASALAARTASPEATWAQAPGASERAPAEPRCGARRAIGDAIGRGAGVRSRTLPSWSRRRKGGPADTACGSAEPTSAACRNRLGSSTGTTFDDALAALRS